MSAARQPDGRSHLHHILRVPVHHRVLQVKPLHVRDGSGFNFLREAKIPTELANFADVELDQQDLLVRL